MKKNKAKNYLSQALKLVPKQKKKIVELFTRVRKNKVIYNSPYFGQGGFGDGRHSLYIEKPPFILYNYI